MTKAEPIFGRIRDHFVNYTISGLFGRIPAILATIKGRLTLAALAIIFIGGALWRASESSTIAIYAITAIVVLCAYVIWIDSKTQMQAKSSARDPPQGQPAENPSRDWTADELRQTLARLPQSFV